MTFVTARPSLPSGHALPGLPGIEKPLHADGAVEIYRLADASERVLLVVPATAEPRAQARARLVPWWELLGQERVVVEKELGGPSFSAVLRLKGEWMASDRRKAAAGEQALLEMFGALLEAAGLTLRSPTPLGRPSLARSLIWWNAGGGGRATPVYLGAAAPAERDLVRDAAALVYLDASGIDPSKAKGPPAPLDRWVKTAGAQATSALGRCLSNGQDRIATLADARRAAGLDRGGDGAAEVEAKPVADRHGTGLAAVAGMKELRTLLEKEVVRPIRDPEPFKKYGLDIPNGILLYGPPGCGKTWIARKLAEEVGHFFVEIIPSEIASPYIHDSVIRIRELFDTAAERAPSVVFIDEFEAMAPSRADLGGNQQYKSEEVNEFLAHLNSCSEKKIFVIAATNEPQKIDSAIRRTGRLDKIIYVGPPDQEARVEMLKMHLAKRPVAGDIDYAAVAAKLVGYSASDIKFLADQAARAAMERMADISEEIVLAARSKVPASVPPHEEARYKDFITRG